MFTGGQVKGAPPIGGVSGSGLRKDVETLVIDMVRGKKTDEAIIQAALRLNPSQKLQDLVVQIGRQRAMVNQDLIKQRLAEGVGVDTIVREVLAIDDKNKGEFDSRATQVLKRYVSDWNLLVVEDAKIKAGRSDIDLKAVIKPGDPAGGMRQSVVARTNGDPSPKKK